MMPQTGKEFFEYAYGLGGKRMAAGCGWPSKGVGKEEKEFLGIIKKSLKRGRMLDIGCGEGRISIFFAKNGFESYGIDFVELAIGRAKRFAREAKVGKKTHFRVGDALELPYPDGFFDAAVDWSVFDHIEPRDWDRYLENLLRVLKPGGFFVLAAFSTGTSFMRGTGENEYYSGDAYFRFFTENEIREIFGKHFEMLRIDEKVYEMQPEFAFYHVLMRKK